MEVLGPVVLLYRDFRRDLTVRRFMAGKTLPRPQAERFATLLLEIQWASSIHGRSLSVRP
jgi:hypothetical protein